MVIFTVVVSWPVRAIVLVVSVVSGWEAMAIFVLVHGAWGGAHGFRKVRGPLRAPGHSVFTPSLTGIGERVHLTGPQVVPDHARHRRGQHGPLRGPGRASCWSAFPTAGSWSPGRSSTSGTGSGTWSTWTRSCPATATRCMTSTGAAAGRGRVIGLGRCLAGAAYGRESSTTRPRPPGPACGARRSRSAALPSRSGWRARWRTIRSRAPTSRRPAKPRPEPGGPFWDAADRAEELARLALPGDRHQPHDPQQPAR